MCHTILSHSVLNILKTARRGREKIGFFTITVSESFAEICYLKHLVPDLIMEKKVKDYEKIVKASW